MIRPLQATDVDAAASVAIGTGMFPEEAREFLTSAATQWLESKNEGGQWLVDLEGQRVVGVAFYEPREATDRTWFLTMIAVSKEVHGRGRGRALLDHVEGQLRAQGERLLLIETSATEQYRGSRRFYERCHYREVARVPDYFEEGDDMVLYWKKLQ